MSFFYFSFQLPKARREKAAKEKISHIEDLLDIDNDKLDQEMDQIYTKQSQAIKNWHKIGTRVHVIRSICFNIVDVDFSGEKVSKEKK